MKGKKPHPLAARIKRIMQQDEDVGKIAQASPILIGKAMELFLEKICADINEVASERGARTINTSHLKECVRRDDLLDFLKDTVADVPDLPTEAEPPRPKRPRLLADSVDGAAPVKRGPGRPPGSGSGRAGRPPGGTGRPRGRPPLRGRGRPGYVDKPVEDVSDDDLDEEAKPCTGTAPKQEQGAGEAGPASLDPLPGPKQELNQDPSAVPLLAGAPSPFLAAIPGGAEADDDEDYDDDGDDEGSEQ
mmetsp:Transcript_14295/g.40478  ORF Transcript_14295/g.40478 Transcript_14295/m.40478 type:complete len:247 (-) Transcript_14295:277-1017(-)